MDSKRQDLKNDFGKIDVSIFAESFPNAIEAIAAVGMYGCQKYRRLSWREVPDAIARYTAAGARHENARLRGEPRDNESDLLHLMHEAWNKLAVLELELRKLRRDAGLDYQAAVLTFNPPPTDHKIPTEAPAQVSETSASQVAWLEGKLRG